jgi:AraC-like DNA-binding protein
MIDYICFMSDRSEPSPEATTGFDILSELLRALRLRGGIRYNATLDAPWGFEAPERKNRAPFYIVTQGECLIELAGPETDSVRQSSGRLAAGDLAMLPFGKPHVVKNADSSRAVPFESLTAGADATGSRPTIHYGGDGPSTNLLIGEFRFDSPLSSAVLVGMDPIVYVRSIREETPAAFEPILRALCYEQRSGLPGWGAATDELVRLLFIHVLRREMARRRREPGPCTGTSFALMFDSSLRGVAELLHRFPEKPWTVASLADEAHMSRTSFAVKFTKTTGMSPFAYLTQVRMLNAIELLSTTPSTLEEIAGRVGYGSEAAFSAAFKREIGVAPGAYRRGRVPAEADA